MGSYMTAEEQCASGDVIQNCASVLVRAQQEFAEWVARELDGESARRIIIAHFGFLQEAPEVLQAMLDAGVTLDTAQGSFLYGLGCDGRRWFAEHPDQWVFGTDLFFEGTCTNYDGWFHMFTGAADEERIYDTCGGQQRVRGMDLDTSDACNISAPPDTAERILGGNVRRLLGR